MATKAKPKEKAETDRVKIRLPYRFNPRDYQLELYRALDSGIKRACLVWHRRAGKDLTMLNYIVKESWRRPGVYYHLLPTFTQAKRIIWDGKDNKQRAFLDYIPKEMIASKSDSEMKIKFINGAIYQLIGTDQVDRLVGPNPIGCVFSEYALQNRQAWKLISPILTANNGWAVFIFTPRGHNHAFELYQIAREYPDEWYSSLLTIDDTGGCVSREWVDRQIRQGLIDDETAQQEYWCSFTSPMSGAYYARLLEITQKAGRITSVPWEPNSTVQTFWDIGIGDSTAIWFVQKVGREIHMIDYYENRALGIDHYAKTLKERPYVYDRHNLPFDAESKELGTGKSVEEMLRNLHVGKVSIVPKLSVEQGIQAARSIIPKVWFDKEKCKDGLDALMNYRTEYDEKRETFKQEPLHDWASHAADAFRYLAVGFRERELQPMATRYQTEFDVFAPNYGAKRHEIEGPTMDDYNPLGG